jgi:septum formation protein
LILASGSPWRRQLLDRLGLAYRAIAPEVDETPRPGETPAELVARLAEAKARAIFERHPEAVVIGADQVAELDGAVLGKPGSRQAAIEQLRRQSGRRVVFHTGVALYAPEQDAPRVECVPVVTIFRTLSDTEIERYVDAEDVTATAGSIKSEGLGITLVESIASDDPTTLVGLPLITVRRMLAEAGIEVPQKS